MTETAYSRPVQTGAGVDHGYGPHVHILGDAWSLSVAAKLGHPDTHPPLFHLLLESAFRRLLQASLDLLPTTVATVPSRMAEHVPGAAYHGAVLDPSAPVVIVDVARGGMIPSYLFQRELHQVLNPDVVRVDHVYMQRVTDDAGRVTGVRTSGSKIGGPVAGATLFVPDPMGATGSSMVDALTMFKNLAGGPPARMIACHLFITPEYLRNVTAAFPDAHIFALRLDRGLSPDDVLCARLGDRWAEERGLSDHDYIVPGAGGMGELINNAFV